MRCFLSLLQVLTRHYNEMANGKWRHAMNDHPRDLPVFWPPLLPFTLSGAERSKWMEEQEPSAHHPILSEGTIAFNACDYDNVSQPVRIIDDIIY